MPFFTLNTPVYTPSFMKVEVSWTDVSGEKRKYFEAANKEQYVVLLLKTETEVLKSILKRYVSQRNKAYMDKYTPASVLNSSLTSLKRSTSLGDVCAWAKSNKIFLLKILPAEESKQASWRKVIPQVIEFAESYIPGNGRTNAIKEFKTIKH